MPDPAIPDNIDPTYHLIYSGKDAYGAVQVLDKDDLRAMHFGTNARQSEMSLSDPYKLTLEYTRLMAISLLFCPFPKSVLFMGLGGGSLPKFMWKHFPQCEIDVVERSPLVIETCYLYFQLPNSKRIAVHEADAFEFIKQGNSLYDLIFIDLYGSDGMSDVVGQEGFFKNCRERLTKKNGVLSWNVWKQTSQTLMLSSVQQASAFFSGNLLILPNAQETNYVLLLLSHPYNDDEKFALMKCARKFQEKTGMDFPEILTSFNFFEDYYSKSSFYC